jgi:uncharacterized protein YeeX (DUF496 family)
MIEKLVYIASQYPGEEIVREIVNKFDGGEAEIGRWYWDIQITNVILLLYLLDRYLEDESDVADISTLIRRELMEAGNGGEARVGDYVVEEAELRYLATRGMAADGLTDTNTLARLMLEHRLPLMVHAMEESLRNQALDSLPPDYGQMTYLVLEFLKQVKGRDQDHADQVSLVTALEGLFEDYYRHIDGQIREYFTASPA